MQLCSLCTPKSEPLCLFWNQLNLFLFPRGSNSDLCGSRALVAAARALLPPKARVGLQVITDCRKAFTEDEEAEK